MKEVSEYLSFEFQNFPIHMHQMMLRMLCSFEQVQEDILTTSLMIDSQQDEQFPGNPSNLLF